jgi:hypothetical protein
MDLPSSGITVSRRQFPLVPAHAVTVHRVQGSTLDGQVHVLLNAEFFAPGQAYVAIGCCRRLSQLHLWMLDMAAFKADSSVASEYAVLRRHPLTLDEIAKANTYAHSISGTLTHVTAHNARHHLRTTACAQKPVTKFAR